MTGPGWTWNCAYGDIQTIQILSELSLTLGCADGGSYFQQTDKCYTFSSSQLSWNDARSECQKYPGGDLAIITDEATNNFMIQNFVPLFTNFGAWIGGIRVSGAWTWADGTQWTGYDKNVEDNSGHDYLFLRETGNWGDWRQTNDFSFDYICQMSPTYSASSSRPLFIEAPKNASLVPAMEDKIDWSVDGIYPTDLGYPSNISATASTSTTTSK